MSDNEPGPSTTPPHVSHRKGKQRAIDPEFTDLNPTITYRHLLTSNMGVKNPLRVVALCDSDAFYAACEHVRLGIDRDLPLVVLQWNALIAVNYPARKFGISRMDRLEDAKKRCPHLVVVHVATYAEGETEPRYWGKPDSRTHKVSLDLYRRESMKIIAMFKEGLPNGEVEKASIDEAFIDFTVPVRDIILERYPYLAHVPPDAPDGIDSPLPPPPHIDWTDLGNLVPIWPDEEDDQREDDEDGDGDRVEDDDDVPTTWHDVALSIAAELMKKIREDIYHKLGYPTSAGIARNKFLAKLSASYKKGMSQNILRNAAIPNYLRPMPFQKIRFLGGKLGSAIAEEYDVKTVGDLLTINLDELQRKFGEGSIWVYEVLRGIDRSEVKEKPAVNKSMLASKNLQTPILKPSEGPHWIRVLAAELALRLNDARETTPGLWPKTLVLHIREGYDAFRSKQNAFPFIRNIGIDHIANAGDKLWKELVGTDNTRSAALKITNVQLAFTGIETGETGQKKIEGFFKPGNTEPEALTEAGPSTESRKRKSDEVIRQSTPRQTTPNVSAKSAKAVEEDEEISFVCQRCGKKLMVQHKPAWQETYDDGGDDARSKSLEALRLEHDDYHFALDVARSAGTFKDKSSKSTTISAQMRSPTPTERPKKRKKDGGKGTSRTVNDAQSITRFFMKKET